MKLVIEESVTYHVEGDTPADAFRAFLAEPNKYLWSVDHRNTYGVERELTIDENEEIALIEMEGA